ncbi:MAG: 3-deoxy-manno-octulosonate cytidylyltransferase, partial [Nitrospinaceae bacterium]
MPAPEDASMSRNPKVVVIVPARWGSTRFPGKPLAAISGKPLVQWVAESAGKAALVDAVIVATDDARIRDAVFAFGGRAEMTSPEHASGSDRIAEVAAGMEGAVVVNVQGDEPLILPDQIDRAVQGLLANPPVQVSSLMTRLTSWEEVKNPNVVKVVTDAQGRALYFSRAPIPYNRDAWGRGGGEDPGGWEGMFRHIGLYAYRQEFLMEYTQWAPTVLERREKLEQLRILEHGHSILMVETEGDFPGVDSPEDLARVQQLLTSPRP